MGAYPATPIRPANPKGPAWSHGRSAVRLLASARSVASGNRGPSAGLLLAFQQVGTQLRGDAPAPEFGSRAALGFGFRHGFSRITTPSQLTCAADLAQDAGPVCPPTRSRLPL